MRAAPLRSALSCLAALAIAGAAPGAGLVIHNAIVWTGDDANPAATAIAVEGNSIAFVGDDAGALALAGDGARVIDARGGFLMPGFSDNHVHFASAARFIEFNIMRTGTQEEFVERVRDVVSRLAPGEWILGGYWGAYDQWQAGRAEAVAREPFAPDMRLVDDITREHPMFIRRFDDSAFAVNRAAMLAAGLDPANPVAEGIDFERDADGRPTGVVRGPGVQPLFGALAPDEFSRERRIAQTKHALAEIRRHGVTNVSDMSDDEQLSIYRELRERGELTCRIHFRFPLDRWDELASQGITIGSGDAWIRLGSLKGHIDGIMGTSSARFFEPYEHEPDNRGRWRRLMVDDEGEFVEGKFLDYMLDADRAGLQLTVHAIGDEANHLLLDYLEELNRVNGPKDRRFRLVHAQVIAPDDFERLGELGVVAEVQPFHLSDDMRWMEERIGRERSAGAYAFRSIADSGAVLSFGTDWPGTSASEYPINPLLGVYAAVARRTLAGEPAGGWFPEQRITVEEALRASTWGTAHANFEEDEKGTLEVGKLADITVLDADPRAVAPSNLLDIEVEYTIVDGEIVYERR